MVGLPSRHHTLAETYKRNFLVTCSAETFEGHWVAGLNWSTACKPFTGFQRFANALFRPDALQITSFNQGLRARPLGRPLLRFEQPGKTVHTRKTWIRWTLNDVGNESERGNLYGISQANLSFYFVFRIAFLSLPCLQWGRVCGFVCGVYMWIIHFTSLIKISLFFSAA